MQHVAVGANAPLSVDERPMPEADSDYQSDDDIDGIRSGKRKRPVSVSYV